MSQSEIDRAGALLAETIGLRPGGVSRRRLARAVERRGDAGDVQALSDAVTVQESGFFREPQHFEALAAELAGRAGPGLIWSAGCANGQEAWSLAMTLVELGRADWQVLATDVSRAALERARAASYSEREARGLDPGRRHRFLLRTPDGRFSVRDELRSRVRFARHNLIAGAPPAEALGAPIVFCRNVLIYLHDDAIARVLEMFSRHIAPDGALFLGASEVLPAQPWFSAHRSGDAFVCRRAAPPAATPPPAPVPQRTPSPAEAVEAGERLSAAGRHAEAAEQFRRAVEIAPQDPLAHVRLALALDQAGDAAGARRAFRAARGALMRSPPPAGQDLGGFSAAELERLIDERLGQPA